MSKQITLRDVPDELHDAIKAWAEQERRSVNSEVLVLLEWAANVKRLDEAAAS